MDQAGATPPDPQPSTNSASSAPVPTSQFVKLSQASALNVQLIVIPCTKLPTVQTTVQCKSFYHP